MDIESPGCVKKSHFEIRERGLRNSLCKGGVRYEIISWTNDSYVEGADHAEKGRWSWWYEGNTANN